MEQHGAYDGQVDGDGLPHGASAFVLRCPACPRCLAHLRLASRATCGAACVVPSRWARTAGRLWSFFLCEPPHAPWPGKGKITFDKGYYAGDFVHGCMAGEGEYVYPNGNRYVGQVRGRRRCALSSLRRSLRTTNATARECSCGHAASVIKATLSRTRALAMVCLSGRLATAMRGRSVETEAGRAALMCCQFVNDKRTGTGTFYWTDGEKYSGEFVGDKVREAARVSATTTARSPLRSALDSVCISTRPAIATGERLPTASSTGAGSTTTVRCGAPP